MKLLYEGRGRNFYEPYEHYQNAIWQSGNRYYELVRAAGQASATVKVAEAVVRAPNHEAWVTHISQTQRFAIDRDEPWETTKGRLLDYLMEMLL